MLRRLNEGQRRNIAHWAMEFVVVVAGVLLALWLQELVTQTNQRAEARKAEAVIRDELDDNLMILISNEAIEQCRKDRLRQIDEILRSGNATVPIDSHLLIVANQKPRVSVFQQRQVWGGWNFDITDTAWRSALANGTAGAMDPDRFRAIANLYAQYANLQHSIEYERDASAKLQVLAYGTALTPDLRARLIEAHTQATRSWIIENDSSGARGVANAMKQLGWNDKSRIEERIRQQWSELRSLRQELQPCAKPFRNPFA